MANNDDTGRKSAGGMGQKPRVPVGPRRSNAPDETPPTRDSMIDEHAPTISGPPPSNMSSPSTTGKRTRSRAGTTGRNEAAKDGPDTVRDGTDDAPTGLRVWLLRVFALALSVALLGLGGIVGLFVYYGRDLPDVHNLRAQWRPPQTTRIFARDGTVLAELFTERRTVIPVEQIPRNLVMALLAAEDADFYSHRGLDYPGMLRALYVNIRRGTTAQGASTITQQLIKNILLTSERSLARKVREVVLARRIESELSKNEILFLYLNHINFGHGRYGVEEAARYYFGKHARELTLGECALLAGAPKSPVLYSPRSHPEAALQRRRWILGQMVDKQFITRAQADAAANEPLRLRDVAEDEGTAPEAVDAARALLLQIVGENAVRQGGYEIHTTIDPALQRAARDALQAGLRELDDRQGYRGPMLAPGVRRARGRPGNVVDAEPAPRDGRLVPGRIYVGIVESTRDPDPSARTTGEITVRVGDTVGTIPWNSVARYVRSEESPSQFAPNGSTVRVSVDRVAMPNATATMRLELGPQASLVAIDPNTREVRALVGGYDVLAGGFDRASRAQRQPGSAFKPFLYSLALSTRRYTLASTFDPNPRCFGTWCPRESHARSASLGPEAPMRLREALAQSRNIVAAQVVTDVTPQALAEHARAVGISTELQPVPSLALGVASVTPLEMTNAYATWAASGRYSAPRIVTRIIAPGGRELPLPEAAPSRQVLSPAEAHLVTSMLTTVIERGTGQRARVLARPIAGKTGTTNGGRDAWFVGYTADLVAGVWVGFDDRQPLGSGEEGARSALPIWVRFVRDYVSIRRPPAVDFVRPDGIVTAFVDPSTGMLARPSQPDALEEIFLSGTEPRQIAITTSDAGSSSLSNFFTMGDGGIPLEEIEDEDAGAADASASDSGIQTAAPTVSDDDARAPSTTPDSK
ncbi:MAG: PBP1A family penicillin-binding protein [Myxococcales bacterium]|nr:PBP1A family penicillin-binding protein [Myxococcales bacterium]